MGTDLSPSPACYQAAGIVQQQQGRGQAAGDGGDAGACQADFRQQQDQDGYVQQGGEHPDVHGYIGTAYGKQRGFQGEGGHGDGGPDHEQYQYIVGAGVFRAEEQAQQGLPEQENQQQDKAGNGAAGQGRVPDDVPETAEAFRHRDFCHFRVHRFGE